MRVVTKRIETTEPTAQPVALAGRKLARFDGAVSIASPESKSFTEVKEESGRVVDYRDVTIKGYLSTFQGTTPSDRDGDYVIPGAFKDTIPAFMRNPVLLCDHRNEVESLIGKFTVVREDSRGLYVEAQLTNSPADEDRSVRFKVAEGILRTMSMGGVFHYNEDDRGIFKVTLWEGSLTPIPANPDAVFSTRALSAAELKKVQSEVVSE